MILLIDNYDSFTFNLYQMVQAETKLPVVVKRNDAITIDEIIALKPKGIILSPGPGHPSNPRDFGVCAQIIERAAELKCPVFGVCLGHQGIGHYLGATVSRAPHIVHGKTSTITITDSTVLLAGLSESFEAMRYHSLIVSEENLPPQLKVTAREPKSNLIMAMEHKSLPLYGVQFHPESIGTPEGRQILKNFLNLCGAPAC